MKYLHTLTRSLGIILISLIACSSSFAQSIAAKGYTFSASSKPYTYLSGGTAVTAINDDDAYTTVPIGFTFTFCGADFSDVTVCSNGWLKFGSGIGSAPANWNYNDVTGGSGIVPAVYPLYEDLSGYVYGNASYLTTGTTGNQVFTMEWRNWLWDYAASTPCVSFQVKLYEATGVIEFLYKHESGAVEVNTSGGATIGICNTTTDWQTINSVTAPLASSTTWTYTLNALPADDMSYVWDPGAACTVPSGFAITNINSKGASFSWNAIGGSAGYEYGVDASSSAPTSPGIATINNSGSALSLSPATTYYVHIRNSCGTYNKSKWLTVPITTLPECSRPAKIMVTKIDSNSADFQWAGVSTATTYQYIVDNSTSTPAPGTGSTSTTSPFVSMKDLTEGTVYYVHYRTLCAGSDSSAWVLDSFRTPVPCRRPALMLSSLTANRAVVYWNPVNTAVEYEYVIADPSTPPAFGTPTPNTSIQFPALAPQKEYNVHVKCKCSYYNVNTESDWSTLDFSTLPPLQINIPNADKTLAVYPNPVRDVLNINILGSVGKDANITVMDIKGQMIKHMSVTANSMTIDMHDLAPGIYLVKYSEGGANKMIKVTKQ